MAAKKRKYKPREFESTGVRNDSSANIYRTMFLSPAFLNLTKNQRLLYITMKSQYYGVQKPGKDFPEIPELQGDDLFYFSMWTAERYGLYTRGNHMSFYKDTKSLVDHGFIEIVSNGRATHEKNIYRYSSKWRTWKDSG